MSDYSLNIRNEEYPKGNLSSKNILIEYGDYECPYSRLGYRYIQKFLKEDTDLKFIFRHFPIKKKHPHAEMCAEAALCAGDQGKFWEMHDLMFADNQNLSRERLEEFAQELDLDRRKFHVDLESQSFLSWVQKDFRSGVKNGVDDTPTFFVNETKYEGDLDYNQLKEFISSQKLI
ncbi:MAG: thioredoxin domain-containing protein [Balneola sp.]|nr:thioredoxin domain-containing protein [Balneola sp.]MBO6650664.1 thioredoxin domain-containing protein [Balneola sp.]MBO6712556.1 thioredoxin domain-containing protein [Balneola sp.]MBO6800950.1 thioredoxin domain-containing protein [Balneola sp.]MBO6870623.1 thioredoxin domain-containing protein [Balneola sp.]